MIVFLKDMSKSVRQTHCNLCGSGRCVLVYKRPKRAAKNFSSVPKGRQGYAISEAHLEKPNKIVRCMTCGLTYAVPDESLEVLAKDYLTDKPDEDYVREEKGRRKQARLILSKISKFKNHGRLLDVGCGPGFFLDEAKLQGWETHGVEPAFWAVDTAKRRFGISVFRGGLREARFADKFFDAVVMMDVLEHLENPVETFEEVRRILKPGGVLYVSTPDIQSFFSRLLGARWWGINKYHLFYFSRGTLEKLFHRVGFRSLRYFAYPRIFSLRYWAKRLETYPFFVRRPVWFLSKIKGWGDAQLKLVLHDQIGVVARKVERLDTVGGEEEGACLPAGREGGRKKLKVTAVLPAYNAEKTLERTVADIPRDVVDEIILVDDASRDHTVKIAKGLGLTVYTHKVNRGYGGNQKTCYEKALEHGADMVVMVHPDYQYDPKIIPELIEPIRRGEADAVFGSRMMKGGALEGGMPLWKHNANVLLTAFENVMLGTYLTEYHSGFRAYSARLLKTVNFKLNSDGFVFDTEIIVQAIAHHFKIEEIPIRTRYFEEASSIRLWPSILYGLGILRVLFLYFLHSKGILRVQRFEPVKEKPS